MREFGLTLLGRAICDATFSEQCRPFAHAMAVVHAAQGIEIILKARIAEEHPLLIFSKLPKPSTTNEKFSLQYLLDDAKAISYSYSELPDRLWAITNYRMKNLEKYHKFGKLRNKIQHFAVPDKPLAGETLRFCIEVVEPILNDFWEESAIPYAEEWDEVIIEAGCLQDSISENKINVPKHVHEYLSEK